MLAAFGAELSTHEPILKQVCGDPRACMPPRTCMLFLHASTPQTLPPQRTRWHGEHAESYRCPCLQIQYSPLAIAGAFVTIVVASLAPVLRNANLDIDGAGPFTRVRHPLSHSAQGHDRLRCCRKIRAGRGILVHACVA